MAAIENGKGDEVIVLDKTEVIESEVTNSQTDDQPQNAAGKRKARVSGDKERKKKLKTNTISDSDKNACMLLNEKCRDVAYDVISQIGPTHMPIFTVEATVNGQTFRGSGPSKKRAKLVAAEMAVNALKLLSVTVKATTIGPEETDFTSDIEAMSEVTTTVGNQTTKSSSRVATAAEQVCQNDDPVPPVTGKHPVLMLNELRPHTEYIPVDEESGERKFKVTVDGQTFEGSGHSKKMAKAKTAEAALTNLFGLMFSYLKDGQPVYQGDDTLWTRYKIKEPAPSVDTVDGKNPIQMLNELFHDLNYEYIDVSNDVTVGTKFCVVLEIQGKTYRGEGTTKKMAKTNCAMEAVKALTDSGILASRKAEKEAKKKRMMKSFHGVSNTTFLDSAVIKLAVHVPDLQYRLVSQNDLWNNGQMSYTVAATVRGENFIANASTEKAAKNIVASKVLSKFGLWSAEDKRMREEAARMEADSTNPSLARGRGKGFRGRGFFSRGVGRGAVTSSASADGFSTLSSNYTAVPWVEQGTGLLGSSSDWQSGRGRGNRGFHGGDRGVGRGTSINEKTVGFPAKPENSRGRGRGSVYGGGAFRGSRINFVAGGLGRGSSGQLGDGGNKKQAGFGQGSSTFSQLGSKFGTRGKISENFGQASNRGARISEGVGESAYQTNATKTYGNKWSLPFSTLGKKKEVGHSWLTPEKSSFQQSEALDNWQSLEKSSSWNSQSKKPAWSSKTEDVHYTDSPWNESAALQDLSSMDTTDGGWYSAGAKSETTAYYDGATDIYGYKSQFSTPGYGTQPQVTPQVNRSGYSLNSQSIGYFDSQPSNLEYRQQGGEYSTGITGNTYEYEATGTFGGTYGPQYGGISYEQYGAYGTIQ